MGSSLEEKDVYKTSRVLYIIEAALEYFIALAVEGVYLAKITTAIGMSDSLTAIVSAFVSLGCGFQIFAIFLANRKPVKKWVTSCHIVSQILFMLMYFVPLFGISGDLKPFLLMAVFLVASIIHNVINPNKIGWYMDLVPNDKRGRFTALKEIVSLLGGMGFSYMLGAIFDAYEFNGNLQGAFLTGGIIIGVLMICHSITLIFSKEKPLTEEEKNRRFDVKAVLRSIYKNKSLLKVTLALTLMTIAQYSVTSFSGTYRNNELGFSVTFSSVIVIAGSLARSLFSVPIGKLGDKKGFTTMFTICLSMDLVAFVLNIFTAPSNGAVCYTAYYVIHCVAMAGTNGCFINLVYDFVQPENRTVAMAFNRTVSGVAGFLITVALSPLMAFIQSNGNSLFGINAYAQQFFSAFGAIVIAVLIVYVRTVLAKTKKVQ